MNASQNQQAQEETITLNLTPEMDDSSTPDDYDNSLSKIKNLNSQTQLLPSRIVNHSSGAGLNPLVDSASYLFSIVGKLKNLKSCRQLGKLQNELVQEINIFQDTAKNNGYNIEYVIVCRYILCATLDEIISATAWGGQNQWDSHSLLAAFNQDTQHHDRFFTIMERAIKEPAIYIDLMELMYLCLSMGYKGQYRATEHSQYQLEQITHNLYKHIRAYRGNFSKTLSPTPLKAATTKTAPKSQTSYLFIFVVTACIVMGIFISLGYLMDVISNEAYKNLATMENSTSHAHPKS